jgi:hypothetical protein
MRIVFALVFFLVLLSCKDSYNAHDNLTNEEYDDVMIAVAPYVAKKPDAITYEARFDEKNKEYYQKYIEATQSEILFFKKTDTANVFLFSYRDMSSLFEHYRGFGGYYKTDENGKISFLNLLFHTPRLTKEETTKTYPLLFKEMMMKGNVNAFLPNKKFIHTPNKDFYYNTKANRWDYTSESSWKFLQEAQQAADSAANIN